MIKLTAVIIKGTKSIAYDEEGNPVDCGLSDAKKKEANPQPFEGKERIVEEIKTIQSVVKQILKDNIDLRTLENRHLVRLIVEQKLDKQVSDESVPRAIRQIQNTEGLFKPEDDRDELEKVHHDYYSENKK